MKTLLVLATLGALIYAKWIDIDTGGELADCRSDLNLAVQARDHILQNGRFLCKMEKSGVCSYRFYIKKGKAP